MTTQRTPVIEGTGSTFKGPAPYTGDWKNHDRREYVKGLRRGAFPGRKVVEFLHSKGYKTAAYDHPPYVWVMPGLFVYPEGVRYFSDIERKDGHKLGKLLGLPVAKLDLAVVGL